MAVAPLTLPRAIQRDMAKDIVYFAGYYMRDDDGNPFEFADFHLELLELCASDKREDDLLMCLEPAAHGKTTIVSVIYPVFCVSMDPNDIIAIGCKNVSDGKDRLRAIKSILENNAALIEDFGPFVGDIWTDDQINVARRTNPAKEPTISVFGSETSVFGGRARKVILDDYVTLQNSGPQVEENTRARLRTNLNDGVLKLAYPKKRFQLRWVNTVVDLRDLVHEKAALHGQMPEDDRPMWESDKGFKVVRRQSLDETTDPPTVLWPAAHTVESLLAEKARDLMTFLRRMQNRCIDPETVAFQRRWIDGDASLVPPAPGCLDYDRILGEPYHGPKYPRWTQTAGYDPNPGQSETSKYCAWIELAFDRENEVPTYYINDIGRFRATLPDQEKFVVQRTIEHDLALTIIESNVQNQWLLQLPGMQAAVKSGRRIEGHHTSTKNKPDPATGIPALAGMVRNGLIRFPYGDARSRQMSEFLIAEMLAYPQGVTSDLLMALWFAILGAKKVSKRMGLRVFGGATIPFLERRGMSADGLDRYFGARVWPLPVAGSAPATPMIGGVEVKRGRLDRDGS